jgi:drug/metabolite transporter (DMT)-like permease
LVTLTPLFLLVTSPLLVQEWPTRADAVGVVLLVVGSYVLNLRTPVGAAALSDRPWAPLVAMIRNPGSRLMLGVALIWSITSNFDKIGVLNSSPLCWAIALFAVIAAGMVPFVFGRRQGGGLAPLLAHWRILTITGGFNAIAIAFQMLALPMAPVTQVIAVKRLSTLLSVVFGHFFFGEKGLQERLIGAAIMVSGVVIMSLS